MKPAKYMIKKRYGLVAALFSKLNCVPGLWLGRQRGVKRRHGIKSSRLWTERSLYFGDGTRYSMER